jgi:CheY-like chemotaxis protein
MIQAECQNNIKPIDVLIVDDSNSDIRITEEIFKRGKVHINLHVAKDGIYALEHLEKSKRGEATRPDLILLDLNMPRKDGRELLEEIKSDDDFKSIPVLIMTVSKAQ